MKMIWITKIEQKYAKEEEVSGFGLGIEIESEIPEYLRDEDGEFLRYEAMRIYRDGDSRLKTEIIVIEMNGDIIQMCANTESICV